MEQLGSAVLVASPPNSLIVGWGKKQCFALCKCSSATKTSILFLLNPICSTNPRHSPIVATVNKIDSYHNQSQLNFFISHADLATLYSLDYAKRSLNYPAANNEPRVWSSRSISASPVKLSPAQLGLGVFCSFLPGLPYSWTKKYIQTELLLQVMLCCTSVNCYPEQHRTGIPPQEAGADPAFTLSSTCPNFCNYLDI